MNLGAEDFQSADAMGMPRPETAPELALAPALAPQEPEEDARQEHDTTLQQKAAHLEQNDT